MALLSFSAGTIGLQVDFAIQEQGEPLADATSATVTWMAQDGRNRLLTLTNDPDAIFSYILSAGDYPSPRYETGMLRVSIGSTRFWQGPFTVAVLPSPL